MATLKKSTPRRESFTACMPLLTATNTFVLGRREDGRVLFNGVTYNISLLEKKILTHFTNRNNNFMHHKEQQQPNMDKKIITKSTK